MTDFKQPFSTNTPTEIVMNREQDLLDNISTEIGIDNEKQYMYEINNQEKHTNKIHGEQPSSSKTLADEMEK